MQADKKNLVRFFFAHLCLVIPVLLVSVLVVSVVAGKMKQLEEQDAIRQLDDVIESFEDNYVNYKEESVLMSSRPELLPYKITGDVNDTYQGIEQLKLKLYYDNRISDVFMDYGTEKVYSAVGVSRKEIFFKNILGLRQESVSRSMERKESGEEVLTFLFCSDSTGYIMYSYPTRQMNEYDTSVNFLMSFEQVLDMLSVTQEQQWYQLQAEDGSVLSVGCDASGNACILSEEEKQRRADSHMYNVVEGKKNSLGMTIGLYYEKATFSLENGLYQMQLFNMLLIVVGIGGGCDYFLVIQQKTSK